jgi:predicted alpha/beta hydrolase family esterase
MGTVNAALNTYNWEEEHLHSARPEAVTQHPALIVPGLNNSDANHWQTLWGQQFIYARRITLKDWHIADLDKWRAGIRQSLINASEPVVLIAHSFGALAAASIAADFPEKIAGLFLVAPADPEKFGIAGRLPQQPLRIPGVLIASSNDPWMKDSKAAYLALLWGANFLRVKNLGHINSHSDIGIWPEGLLQYQKLVERIEATRPTFNSTHKG